MAEGRLREQFEDELMDAMDEFEEETEEDSSRYSLIGAIILILVGFILYAMISS
jgi:hypothetical protein